MLKHLNIARFAPPFVIILLIGPICFGLFGTFAPAFGYLPSLGGLEFSLTSFKDLFAVTGLWQSAFLSLASGLSAAFISLMIVMGFIGGFGQSRVFRRVRQLTSPLLSVPHAAAAFGFAFMIAPSGFLMRAASPWLTGFDRPPDLLIINDPWGITLTAGLVIKEIPFLFLVSLAALPQLRFSETMVFARSIGFGRITGFIFLVWPSLYKQIRLAVYAVVAYATAVVDVAAILGPHLPPTLPIRLLDWMGDPDLSMRFLASAGAVFQLGVTLFALAVWFGMEWLGGCLTAFMRNRGFRGARDQVFRIGFLSAISMSAILVFGGIIMLAIWSFSGLWQFPDLWPQNLTTRSWMRSLPRIVDPLITTLVIGVISTLVAVILTILCLERENQTGRTGGNRALALIYLPLIIPQLSFVFGLQVFAIGFGVDGKFYTLAFVHLIFVLPYVFLSLSDSWRALDKRYDIIATGLGKNRFQVLMSIRIPLLTRAILSAAAVGFAVSISQYLPTVLIGAGRIDTITTEAISLASGGNRRVIGVYAFLQTLLPFFAFTLVSIIPALLFRNRRAMRV